MSALTAKQLDDMRISINAAMLAVAKQHKLSELHAGRCSYNPDGSFTFQLKGVVAGGLDKEASTYDATRKYNDDMPARGTSFVHPHDGKTYTITGLRGRKVRLARDNKEFYMVIDAVLKQVKTSS